LDFDAAGFVVVNVIPIHGVVDTIPMCGSTKPHSRADIAKNLVVAKHVIVASGIKPC